MAIGSIAPREDGTDARELTDLDHELQAKLIQIVGDFGPKLLETPVSDLKRMADMQCNGDNRANLFGQMWDKYRFVPTVSLLRKLDEDVSPDLPALIRVMQQVWDDSADGAACVAQDVA